MPAGAVSPRTSLRRGARAPAGAARRPDHRAGSSLARLDALVQRKAADDLECRLDDRVAREARRDRFEVGDLAGNWDETVLTASAGNLGAPRIFGTDPPPLSVPP
jgi:hypothetical protein